MADPRYERLQARLATGEEMVPEVDPMTMEEGAEAGRKGDTVLAHLTPGELVVPLAMLEGDADFAGMMKASFEAAGVNMNQFIVGHEENAVNPETGYPEFGFLSSVGGFFKKAVKTVAKPFVWVGKRITGMDRVEDQMRRSNALAVDYQAMADRHAKQMQQMMKQNKLDMQKERRRFEASMAASNARNNRLMAEQRKKAKFEAIKSQRKFSDMLSATTGSVDSKASANVAKEGGGGTGVKGVAGKSAVGGVRRKRKAQPRFARRAKKSSAMRRPY
tara:strand:- start:1806 stop:2630 length:825 start_codon:yes stop_codon:yes gene_type:complete